jgi:5-methylcytosine-specific restriction endonuclease McrA
VSKYAKSKWKAPPGWAKTRKIVLGRDKYTCQGCGAKVGKGGRKAHVHHLLGKQSHKVYDLITLCATCHEVVTILSGPGYRLLAPLGNMERIQSYALTYLRNN